MNIDPANFLLSLAYAMAAAAVPPSGFAPIVLGTNLFSSEASEATADADAAAYAVLRIYGGPQPEELLPIPQASVQCMAACKRPSEAMRLCQCLFETLYSEVVAGVPRPRNGWVIPAKKLTAGAIVADASMPFGWRVRVVKPLGTPGSVGRDERGKTIVSFNFDVSYSKQLS